MTMNLIFLDDAGNEHEVEQFQGTIRSNEIGGPGFVPFTRFRLVATREIVEPTMGASAVMTRHGLLTRK